MFKMQMLYPTSVCLFSYSSNIWVFCLDVSLLLCLSPITFMPTKLFSPFLFVLFFLPQFHCRSSSVLVSGTCSSCLQKALNFLSQFCFLSYLKFSNFSSKGSVKTPHWLNSAQNRKTKHHMSNALSL